MATKMSLTFNTEKHLWEFVTDGRTLLLSDCEIAFLSHQFVRNEWECNIEDVVDEYEDSLDFTTISREDFIELCLEELDDRWEIYGMESEPNYQDLVEMVAEDNAIWRD